MGKISYTIAQINTTIAKVTSAFNATTGHKHTGDVGDAPLIGISKGSFVIAPSNAINKEHADLILAGTGTDAADINTALTALSALRGEGGTQVLRVDFLGGDIDAEETITIPDYFNIYGNGVALTQGAELTSTAIISGNICNIEGITVGNISGTSFSGINVTTGNVSNCIVGNISGTASSGINVTTGNISNCTVGDVHGTISNGIYVGTGNVSNCIVGSTFTGSTGIWVTTGINNIISGNKILGGSGSTAKGINVVGSTCIITNNNIGTATDSFVSISGTAIKHNNYYNGDWQA